MWNFANATSAKAAHPFVGPPKWLTAFDLDRLSSGASEYVEHAGAATMQRVKAGFVNRRKQCGKVRLRWRVSRGPRRSRGWIPFKPEQLKRKTDSLPVAGKALRVFERHLLEGLIWRCGCFAQDFVGDWWLCLPGKRTPVQARPFEEAVGLVLGLKDVVTTSDGEKLSAGRFPRY